MRGLLGWECWLEAMFRKQDSIYRRTGDDRRTFTRWWIRGLGHPLRAKMTFDAGTRARERAQFPAAITHISNIPDLSKIRSKAGKGSHAETGSDWICVRVCMIPYGLMTSEDIIYGRRSASNRTLSSSTTGDRHLLAS